MTNSPKQECLTLLRQLFEQVPEFEARPTIRSPLKTVARMCKLCEMHYTRFSEVMLTAPALVVVLDGRKSVTLQSRHVMANEGDFLLLPNGVNMDMQNELSPTQGVFRSIIIEFEPNALRRFTGFYPDLIQAEVDWHSTNAPSLYAYPPSVHEAETFMHLSKALARGEGTGPTVELRLFELILSLLQSDKGQILFALTSDNIAENARNLLELHPSRPWTVEGVATQLGVSGSTLTRRLRKEGQSFRNLLRNTRMNQAKSMFKTGAHSIAEVAEACGYTSLPRFRSRFETHFGHPPDQIRN